MAMSKRMKEAIGQVFEELKAMSPEEFRAELEKHKGGDIARLLQYAWNPDMPANPDTKGNEKWISQLQSGWSLVPQNGTRCGSQAKLRNMSTLTALIL